MVLEQHNKLQELEVFGKKVGENIPFDIDLLELCNAISSQMDALDAMEAHAFEQNRQNKTRAIKENLPPPAIPLDHRAYQPNSFY
jgi:hypothetical protein